MSVRRCPGCHNLVERSSEGCPVCGQSWTHALLARVARWAAAIALVGFIAYEGVRHYHHG
jgi:hypothetical protein